MKVHEFLPTLQTYVLSWRRELLEADVVFSQYEKFSESPETLGRAGRVARDNVAYLQQLLAWAEAGLLYREPGDRFDADRFERADLQQYTEFVALAESLRLCVWNRPEKPLPQIRVMTEEQLGRWAFYADPDENRRRVQESDRQVREALRKIGKA